MTEDQEDDPFRLGDYLALNQGALERLDPVEQVKVLALLAREAPKWIADYRANLIDELRLMLGGDAQVAEALGVERQSIADLGDGPVVRVADGLFIKPRLLRRAIDLILAYSPDMAGDKNLLTAAQELNRAGRPNAVRIRGAALRLVSAARKARVDTSQMTPEERRAYSRSIAHVAEVSTYRG